MSIACFFLRQWTQQYEWICKCFFWLCIEIILIFISEVFVCWHLKWIFWYSIQAAGDCKTATKSNSIHIIYHYWYNFFLNSEQIAFIYTEIEIKVLKCHYRRSFKCEPSWIVVQFQLYKPSENLKIKHFFL